MLIFLIRCHLVMITVYGLYISHEVYVTFVKNLYPAIK